MVVAYSVGFLTHQLQYKNHYNSIVFPLFPNKAYMHNAKINYKNGPVFRFEKRSYEGSSLMFPLFHSPHMILQAYIPRACQNLRLGTAHDRRVALSSLSSLTHQCHYQHILQEMYQNFVHVLDFDPNMQIHPQVF